MLTYTISITIRIQSHRDVSIQGNIPESSHSLGRPNLLQAWRWLFNSRNV